MGNKDQNCPASAMFVQQDVEMVRDKVSLEFDLVACWVIWSIDDALLLKKVPVEPYDYKIGLQG